MAILMLIQVAAYGQLAVSSTPVATVISTGTAEVAGTIVFTAGPSGAVSDTITIRYGGLPITNIGTTGISVTGSIGSGTGGWGTTPPQFTVTASTGLIEVRTLGAGNAGNTITVSGVRVSVSGSGLTFFKATLTSVANPLVVGGVAGNEVTVISALAAGIAEVKSVTKPIFLATTGSAIGAAGAAGSFTIKEGFTGAFKSTAQAGPGATQSTQIRLRATGLTTGVTVTIGTITGVTGVTPSATTLSVPTTAAPTANVSTLDFTADTK